MHEIQDGGNAKPCEISALKNHRTAYEQAVFKGSNKYFLSRKVYVRDEKEDKNVSD